MESDDTRKRWVRKYLATGEQPANGIVLVTRTYPQRRVVIAKDSASAVLWAFVIAKTGYLQALEKAYLIALETEERKA